MIDGPVVISILEGIAGARTAMVIGYIAQAHIVPEPLYPGGRSGGGHCAQHGRHIGESYLGGHIGEYRRCMIAAHAPSLVGHQVPHGQHTQCTLLLNAYHALCHVHIALRVKQAQQGMLSAISVPEGEYGVVGKAVGTMNLHIISAVRTIYIHIHRGVDHRMIE